MEKLKYIALGAAFGASAIALGYFVLRRITNKNLATETAVDAKRLLPKRVILVRHGESEGNVDAMMYRVKADNLLELTPKGIEQATAAGERLKKILGNERVELYVSPFERTLQTQRSLRVAIESNIIDTWVDPLIREQEFGNLQGEDFQQFREEQKKVGRFFYRFPTGESGADVYTRVKLWWNSVIDKMNMRPGREYADTVVVVTHGLTMRLILMQVFGWSPNTFSSVWNADNCQMFIVNKDDSLPGDNPYRLDRENGDDPKSAIDISVTFTDGTKQMLKLNDYLKLTPPRTMDGLNAARMLSEQHQLDLDSMQSLDMRSGRAGYDRSLIFDLKNIRSTNIR